MGARSGASAWGPSYLPGAAERGLGGVEPHGSHELRIVPSVALVAPRAWIALAPREHGTWTTAGGSTT